jgi:hypothetical protein
VIHPDPGRVPDGDAVIVLDKGDLQVLNDDIGRVDHIQAAAGDVSRLANANDGLVGPNLWAGSEVELPLDLDNPALVTRNSCFEVVHIVDRHGGAPFSARGWADRIVFGETLNVPSGEAKPAEGGRCHQRSGG